MKTTILYIDDDPLESSSLKHQVTAELCKIDPDVVVISAENTVDPLPEKTTILSFKIFKPNEVPPSNAVGEIGVLAQNFAFFMLDICWSSHDVEDDAGLKYAVCLHAAGVAESRILLVTNKAFDATLRKTGLRTLPGEDGVHYPAASKGKPEKIAQELHARTSLAPNRNSIAVAEAINTELYSGKRLDAFFHLAGCKQKEALESCKALSTVARDLPEAAWLVCAVSRFLRNNTDEIVKNYLASYLVNDNDRSKMVQERTDQTLQAILACACQWSGATKLRDCLFPRLKPTITEPGKVPLKTTFVNLVGALANEVAVKCVNWEGGLRLPFTLQQPSYDQGESGVSGVPLSWFKGLVKEGWLFESAKNAKIDRFAAHVFGTKGSKHCCVAFWHEGQGFDSVDLIKSQAPKTVQTCARYCHVFVASRLCKDPKCPVLCEMLPDGQSLEKPQKKIQLGETLVDFTNLKQGTVYLFVFPAIK